VANSPSTTPESATRTRAQAPRGGAGAGRPRTRCRLGHRLHVHRQGQARAHDGQEHEAVGGPGDLLGGIPDRPTQRAARGRTPAGARPVQRQPDEAGVFDGLVARGPAHARHQRLPRGAGSQCAVTYARVSSPKRCPTPNARRAGERTRASMAWKAHSRSTWPMRWPSGGSPRESAAASGRPRLRQVGSQAEVAADEPGQSARVGRVTSGAGAGRGSTGVRWPSGPPPPRP